ncbi:hypothetical protein PRZ48_005277 [Zasmidium cellare]|uniref:Terpene synthase n=1 Tax=Zasmidium cellare TaxID=395010 RepID=A0ABR0ERZ5_ZASCE|nr:hypothetical protein PRZ48_005277 [Zasmidium cellare]
MSATIHPDGFPMDRYVVGLLRLLDKIEYNDANWTPSDRLSTLRYCWMKGAHYFAQSHVQETLNLESEFVDARLATVVQMVVYSWSTVPLEVKVDLSFLMIAPKITLQQCARSGRIVSRVGLQIILGYDFSISNYLGLWIENAKFGGYAGSRQFPLFLRRLTGLGHAVGATLFPSEDFDDQELFGDITSAIVELDYYMFLVNDFISFYKEYEQEDMILVKNYARTESISVSDALDKVSQEAIEAADRLMCVFATKHPSVFKAIRAFMHGYRTKEVVASLDGSEAANRLRDYYEQAQKTGQILVAEWATPSIGDIVTQNKT